MLRAGRLIRRIDAFWRMCVDGPAAIGDSIGKGTRSDEVVLGEDVLTDEAAALALARQEADPLQGPMRSVDVGVVFDEVPHAERDGEQFVADRLVVLDGVEAATPLDPPVAVFEAEIESALSIGPKFEIARRETPHPRRCHKRHRAVMLAGLEHD